ncbi:hypothetical protein JRT77_005592, partial [Escherichia coli]|nr:hypothetical protein [Escherichia coli]EFH5311926.1 hypothetical protein [Escherichia coli]EHD2957339.1 hypothetical protein [Escherichia coli]
MRRPASSYAS